MDKIIRPVTGLCIRDKKHSYTMMLWLYILKEMNFKIE
jgi:hypothetical protein